MPAALIRRLRKGMVINMANKGILSKNYYIVPEAVADLGAEVYNMMAEADQVMTEASEIIAEIASLTERVPSHIRCNELLEACASAQAEIKSVDFLSYGQKVDQGLQNLLDHNQYITEHFIKNMETHTEKMRGLGEEFKRLSELITYSGEGVQLKGIVFSAASNAEIENTDGEEENPPKYSTDDLPRWGAAEVLEVSAEEIMAQEENASNQGQNDILKHFNACDAEKLIAIRLLDTQIYNELGITNLEDRQMVIQSILDNKSYVFDNLYILNSKSGADYQRQMSNLLSDIEKEYISIIFSTYSIEKQIAIRLLDIQIYNELGITNLEDRQMVIQSILDNKSYVFDNLYILNSKSGADYQRQMSNLLSDIEKEYISIIFSTYSIEKQIAIKLLDTQIYSRLGIADLSERQRIIETILREKSYVLDNLYILNSKSGTDYQKVMYNTLFEIEQKNRFLTEKGLLFLYELELGNKEEWDNNVNIHLDQEGNIIEIKIHDAHDGGYTIGPGIYIAFDDQNRIDFVTSLGITWNDTNEWVSIENVKIIFFEITQYYHGLVKSVEKNTDIIFTPEQYDAIFSLLYFRPAFYDNITYLINSNADKETWRDNLIEELQGLQSYDKNSGWDSRIERTVELYFEGEY